MKKRITIFLLTVICMFPLFSISFGYNIVDIGVDSDFAAGTFPLYVDYGFNFPVPDFINGNATILSFNLRNGLVPRTLRQNPETGVPYAMAGLPDYPTRYTVLMDEFELVLGQGFGKTPLSPDDTFTLWVSFGGRFENAYERLSWAHTPADLDALFSINVNNERVPRFNSFSGAPELAGDRSVFTGFLLGGLNLNFMSDNVTTRTGAELEVQARWCPPWLFWGDDSAQYLHVSGRFDLSGTLFSAQYQDHSFVSIVADNSTYYRYLTGPKIPVFIQTGGIWGVGAENLTNYISNSLSLTLYIAPFPKIDNIYLSCRGFFDIAYAWGQLLNTADSMKYSDLTASTGVRFSASIFSILEAYYELGYVIANSFNLPADKAFQATFGLRLTV